MSSRAYGCDDVAGLHQAYIVGIALHPCTHILRHILRVDAACVGIAKDGWCTLVAADDDEAVAVAYVVEIHLVADGIGKNLLLTDQLQICSSAFGLVHAFTAG